MAGKRFFVNTGEGSLEHVEGNGRFISCDASPTSTCYVYYNRGFSGPADWIVREREDMNDLHRLWLIALLIVGVLTGCGAPDGEPGAGRNLDPAPTGAGSDDIALPIDSYGYTAVEVGQMILAREILTTDCLRRLDSRNVEEPDRAALEQVTRSRMRDLGLHGNNRRYGVSDPEITNTYGYHLPSTVDGSTTTTDIDKKTAEPRPEPQRRCLDEATKIIAGTGPLGNSDLVRKIAWESYEHSLRSPTVTEAVSRWSSCMATKGYGYATPQDAESAFDLNSTVVTEKEIATAVADVSCKQKIQLVDTWYSVEKDYQSVEIAKHARELEAAKKAHDECMRSASDVITKHP